MSDDNDKTQRTVLIVFREPHTTVQLRMTDSDRAKMVADWERSSGKGGGVYDATRDAKPVKLMVRFSDVLYIA